MTKKIAIFCGGPSSEHEVSLNSASTIYQYIDKNKYELYFFFISKKGHCKLILATENVDFTKISTTTDLLKGLGELKRKKIFAFLAGIHGEFVEDGRLQSLLEYLEIPYSGSGVSASSLAMDKFKSSLIVGTLDGITLPKTRLVDSQNFPKGLLFPVIIKPNTMGSSVGVTIAHTIDEFDDQIENLIEKYPRQEIIVQEYVKDATEIQCGTLQSKDRKFIPIPPIEIIPNKNVFFDYDSKYKIGGASEITPPKSISKMMSDEITILSQRIHSLLALTTYSRIDYLVKGETIYFLEANTLPGMTATSLLPQEAKAIGISFPQLLDFLIINS